jgi:hypothetical protein
MKPLDPNGDWYVSDTFLAFVFLALMALAWWPKLRQHWSRK